MNYSKAIKIVRASKDLSQKDLSEKVGLDASYISMIEAGRRQPTFQTLEAISKALEVPFYLFTLLASEDQDLKKINEKDADKIGRELLNVLVSTGFNSK
jgi:transcriptional regulator with XRE-family HTH domain